MNFKLVKAAFLKTLPVLAGYVVLGMGFGILLKVNGFGLLTALAMSIFIFAGSMQYVGISLLAGGASLISIALTTFMVNARHLFYGISMIDRYKGAGFKKFYLMHGLSDETYSLVCTGETPEGADPHLYYLLISAFDQSYWVTGTVIGVLLGSLITFDAAGIDFSMTALFVTVFVEQWITTKEHLPAVIGVAGAIFCLILWGPEHFLIPAMVVITVLLTLCRKYLKKREAEHHE